MRLRRVAGEASAVEKVAFERQPEMALLLGSAADDLLELRHQLAAPSDLLLLEDADLLQLAAAGLAAERRDRGGRQAGQPDHETRLVFGERHRRT